MITRPDRRWRKTRHGLPAAGLPADYRISFGACYAYSPKGHNEVSARSRLLRARLKGCNIQWLQYYALRVHEQVIQQRRFRGYFGDDTLLIPVPRSRAGSCTAVWAARHLALAIHATGLGYSVWTGLSRSSPVDRSSAAWFWERPTVQEHYRSLAVGPSASSPAHVVLIDDVVTKGRTLVAAAMRLQQAFPQARIQAFALLRTMGFVPDIERLIDPCQGEIRWNGEEAYRAP